MYFSIIYGLPRFVFVLPFSGFVFGFGFMEQISNYSYLNEAKRQENSDNVGDSVLICLNFLQSLL